MQGVFRTDTKMAQATAARLFSRYGRTELIQSLSRSVSQAAQHKVGVVLEESKKIFEQKSCDEAIKSGSLISQKCNRDAVSSVESNEMLPVLADLLGAQEHKILARCLDQDPKFATNYIKYFGPINLAQMSVYALKGDMESFSIDNVVRIISNHHESLKPGDQRIFDESLKMASAFFPIKKEHALEPSDTAAVTSTSKLSSRGIGY